MITLYGTNTSPFVRKVRIHLLEMGLAHNVVNTLDDAGQAELRKVNPLWKIPAAVFDDGRTVFDSRVLLTLLWEGHRDAGVRAGLRPMGSGMERWDEENLLTVIDGVVDSAINRFYLLRDGLPETGYVVKQRERVDAAMHWLAERLRGGSFLPDGSVGVPEISLVCALDWLTFRAQYAWQGMDAFARFRDAHRARPSVAQTMPGT
ncbi:MAG: glutathione S-transferase family protein [Myxococcota bacterium]